MTDVKISRRMPKAQLVALAAKEPGMTRARADAMTKPDLVELLGGKPAPGSPSAEQAADDSHSSWDAFWSEVEREEAAERGEAATETIRGQTVPVPHDLPLRFDRRLDRVQAIEREAQADPAKFMADRAAMLVERDALRVQLDDGTADERAEAERDLARVQRALEDVDPMEATKALLRDLFGRDVLDAWVEAGMTESEFQVVLLWGMAHGKGAPMTFRQAYTAYKEQESGKGARPVPNRAEKRAAGKKKPPDGTGGR